MENLNEINITQIPLNSLRSSLLLNNDHFFFSISFIVVIPNIPADATWAQDGVTVAGGHGLGNATNQLWNPQNLIIDNETMLIVHSYNSRIIQWKIGDENGQVIVGNNGEGNRLDQLKSPTDVLIDKETDSLIICDSGNRRIV
ncbi:unnamed protein product [Rotaria sp. Silwood2]|nr:unnamed protein product [Rotaria sp. Silwood2]